MTSPRLFDDPRSDTRRGGKEPVEVSLFVHKENLKSLLCSEHGENRYLNGRLVDGKIVGGTLITWPDDKQLAAFRRWQVSPLSRRQPVCLTFAVPEWFAMQEGLI